MMREFFSNFVSKEFLIYNFIIVKHLFLLIALFTTLISSAADFVIDDNSYNVISLDDMTCSVTISAKKTGILTIPEKVTYKDHQFTVIMAKAEAGLTLTELHLPETIESIYSFNGCNIEHFILPNSVQTIGSYCFRNARFNEITLSSSLKYIGEYAFLWCENLKSINIPGSVTSIGNSAFEYCNNLSSVKFEDSEEILRLGYDLNNTYEGYGVFHNLPIENLYIGRNFSYYYGWSGYLKPFVDCNKIKNISFGKHVTNIDYNHGYSTAETITCYAIIPPKLTSGFSNSVYMDSKLYIPTGTLESYKNAQYWSNFWDTQEFAGINNVLIDFPSENEIYYDVNGHRVLDPRRGIYIKVTNGKAIKIYR